MQRFGSRSAIKDALTARTLDAPSGGGGSASAALSGASFVTLGLDASLASERVLVGGNGLTLTDGGAGGNVALAVGAGAGITVTADAVAVDGTVARSTWPVTAGAGLTGGGNLAAAGITLAVGAGAGLSVNADDVALTTPGTLTVATANVAAGSHTHAITSSANPGAAASLLATDADGSLILDTDVLRVSATVNAVWINSGTPDGSAAVRITAPATDDRSLVVTKRASQTADLLQIEDESGADYWLVTADGKLESGNPGFVSGLTGTQLTPAGLAEFNHIIARGEFRASIFTIGEVHATGGTMLIRPAGVLHAQVTTQ